ncbi:unnamed protein product [Camellia sinensis]
MVKRAVWMYGGVLSFHIDPKSDANYSTAYCNGGTTLFVSPTPENWDKSKTGIVFDSWKSKRVEYLVSLFEEIKKSGPLPNVRSYTIMMNFYCKGHYAVDIRQATGILEEMESGESPTVVTYSTYIHGLCRIGFVEFALNLIRKLRQKYQLLIVTVVMRLLMDFAKEAKRMNL